MDCDHTLSDLAVVDSEDKFYHVTSIEHLRETAVGVAYGDSSRNIYSVEVPVNTEIKRVRITPKKYTNQQVNDVGNGIIKAPIDAGLSDSNLCSRMAALVGDPFSIEWTGVPEVKDSSLYMKFYGIKFQDIQHSSDRRAGIMSDAMIDVKIKNNGTVKQRISNDQFEVVDQFGFTYTGRGETNSISAPVAPVDLMPGESVRFNVVIEYISPLSRPIYLKHTSFGSNLTMDISAWA